ncbi:DUF4783 domain-containing protein [Labilibacter marinus]|uniref:DUF4783 domain-containing protein n=1 Tax=Labilibacter marinus TaxID=1477105 RepID=UPI00094FEFEA|nr:DUF4783 domain-containing protein [Labilibacter marinus]
MNILRSITTRGLVLISFLFTISVNSFGQFPDEIISATKQGNAVELAKHFNDKIELVLPQKSGVFSNAQAKLVLSDFFSRNKVNTFKIIHQGIRESSSFAIGKYQSNTSTYRFYFLTKNKGSVTYIHQLRIEKQDD